MTCLIFFPWIFLNSRNFSWKVFLAILISGVSKEKFTLFDLKKTCESIYLTFRNGNIEFTIFGQYFLGHAWKELIKIPVIYLSNWTIFLAYMNDLKCLTDLRLIEKWEFDLFFSFSVS